MLRSMKAVAVVGLGKIGLPLAAQYASKGMNVIGCDVLPEVVATINAGHSHIHEETGLEEAVAGAVKAGRLRATVDTAAAVQEAAVTVVIVPLMVGPGAKTDFRTVDAATYWAVKRPLANQLAMYAASREVNVGEAFKAANSQPFSHIHRPSIGVGGHCIPVYPHFLLGDATNGELSLVRDGRAVNDRMAEIGVRQLDRLLGGLKSQRVLVLGASYREDVKELAFSTVLPIVDLLHRAGANVHLLDPHFR